MVTHEQRNDSNKGQRWKRNEGRGGKPLSPPSLRTSGDTFCTSLQGKSKEERWRPQEGCGGGRKREEGGAKKTKRKRKEGREEEQGGWSTTIQVLQELDE